MADAVITTDPGISHDEVMLLLDATLDELDVTVQHEDASTLAHHLRGIAGLLPRLGLTTPPDQWIERCVRALCEALAADRPTVPDGQVLRER